MISLRELYFRQGGRCIYCEQITTLNLPSYVLAREGIVSPDPPSPGSPRSRKLQRYRRATREHIVRKADGGSDGAANLLMACEFCNSFRGETDPKDHKVAMMSLVVLKQHPLCVTQPRSGGQQRRLIKEALMVSSAPSALEEAAHA